MRKICPGPPIFRFFHLAAAAFLAICDLRLLERAKSLAFPPFRPPSLPSSTAAGFFSRVVCSTIEGAIWFRSPLRGLFSLPPNCLKPVSIASCPLFAASCKLRRRLSDCSSRSIATFQVFLSAFFTPRLCLSGQVLQTLSDFKLYRYPQPCCFKKERERDSTS
jgi:hypothetical protein